MSFYVQVKNTGIRKETFARNAALIEQKYGQAHLAALGEGAKINKYGYPDIGNNIYADLLPYRDWVRVNNAQRCHENLVSSMIIFFPNAFIGLLSFPKTTLALMYAFLLLRVWHIKGYLSFRGHNKAYAAEEFSKLTLVILLGVSIASSLSMLGVLQRLSFLRAYLPKRLLFSKKAK
jgi:hypothetical protein